MNAYMAEFLGTAIIAAVTTTTGDVSAAIDTKMTALGVTLDDGDLLQLHFSERTGSGMIVLGDSDQAVPASAFVIPGRTSPPFQWTGYRSDIPQVRAATGTATRRPTNPKSAPKAESAKISQTGCSPTEVPTSLGVRMLPSTN